MVNIPRDYVELDCREEGKVNLPEIHVTCDAQGDWMGFRHQIIANNLRNVWRNGKLFVSLRRCYIICGLNLNYAYIVYNIWF